MNWLLSIRKTIYFEGLTLVTIIFALASKYLLTTDELYYASYAEQFTTEQVKSLIAYSNSSGWQYLEYLVIPLIIIIRALYTSFCLQIGNLVQEYHWKYKRLYNISLKADVIYLFSMICNFYFYAFFQPPTTIQDLNVNFLSYLKVKGIGNIPNWLVPTFNSINLFELSYVVLLILLIKTSFQLSYPKSAIFILLTYVVGNYLYVVALTFIYLNFTQ
jgi:hypothetical protein